MSARLGVALVALAMGTAAAAPDAASTAAAQPLDLAALAAQSKTSELDEDAVRAALVKGQPDGVVFSRVLDLGDGKSALGWSECDKRGCHGQAALIGGSERPKLLKKAKLVAPARVFSVDGFSFEAPALADLDGDGAPEIVLRYRASEPPRAALGSLAHEYVAAYSSRDLALVFVHELRRAGGDSEDACQWTFARRGDTLVADGRCNVRSCLEAATPEASCPAPRALSEAWRKAPGQARYRRVAGH